ncbi:hypothetical protein LUZ63_015217 [Rhynchospora breviuscula]|uniref:Uncharacterized protein n=1 Tax=Rhynchospora breviuscula TaxID=2022672 RepID=A0A9Q0HLX9_9POAL|nr:hypothetical protein LUZ63_015217 [Rhynchospora breviuscula]
MASRCRALSRPAFSFLKSSSFAKTSTPLSPSSLPRPSPSFTRVRREMALVESLLPLHSAVSSARLTSRLGIDASGLSRSLSQGMLCQSNPGV